MVPWLFSMLDDFVHCMSRNGVDFVDLESGDVDINKWVRGMCQYGIMPANGLLYAPTHPCQSAKQKLLL